MSHAIQKNPVTGDMYKCQKCSFELQVITECDCDKPNVDLNCCGEDMKNITVQEVPSSVGK